MIVITLTDCPPALRGDLTKWLFEINVGVYVGQVSARVRDALWQRVKEYSRQGRATLVYSTNNEQKMNFLVHNSEWEPIDFDGLQLMLRPVSTRPRKQVELRQGFSNAAQRHRSRQTERRTGNPENAAREYLVLDIRTTGSSPEADKIVEINALAIRGESVQGKFRLFVCEENSPPPGATVSSRGEEEQNYPDGEPPYYVDGKPLGEVMRRLQAFAGNMPIVSRNENFDRSFLATACERNGLSEMRNRFVDVSSMARRLVDDVRDHKYQTLLEHFNIQTDTLICGLSNCKAMYQLFQKLIEIRAGRL